MYVELSLEMLLRCFFTLLASHPALVVPFMLAHMYAL